MSKVAVVYWTGTGNTGMMAEGVAEGAKADGAKVAGMVTCQNAPDDGALEECRALGRALA